MGSDGTIAVFVAVLTSFFDSEQDFLLHKTLKYTESLQEPNRLGVVGRMIFIADISRITTHQ